MACLLCHKFFSIHYLFVSNLTPNGVTYIPYDGDSSKAWEIDMPGSCYATARKCLAAENDCADISAWTKNLKGIKIYIQV